MEKNFRSVMQLCLSRLGITGVPSQAERAGANYYSWRKWMNGEAIPDEDGGVDVRRAMSALGHASMATTMQYVHAAGELADTGVLPFGGGEPVTIHKEDRDGIQSYPQRKPRTKDPAA
jgi:integrase